MDIEPLSDSDIETLGKILRRGGRVSVTAGALDERKVSKTKVESLLKRGLVVVRGANLSRLRTPGAREIDVEVTTNGCHALNAARIALEMEVM